MTLWDKLRKKDIFQEYADNMQPLQPVQQTQPLNTIQVQANDAGGVDLAPVQEQQAPTRRGLSLIDRLFGVQAAPTDNIDTNTMNVTVSNNPRVGGLFNDIASGARENFATGFAAPNLYDDKTADGRRKGFAYRLGEGLGTAGRFLESPLGRGLLVAGIVGATGGNGLQALAYGGQAGSLNQRLRYQNQMYKNEMINNAQNSLRNSPEFNTLTEQEQRAIYDQLLTNPDGTIRDYNSMTDAQKTQFENDYRQALANRLYENQQTQLSNIAEQINNMKGYVTDDIYNNFVRAQQLRDNADYRNMMANLQMQNNQALQDFRKDQAEYQRQKDAADRQDRALTRALTARGQDLNYGLGMARLSADAQKANAKQSAKQQDAMSTLNQIGLIRDMVRQNPNATGLSKGFVTGDLLNRIDSNPNHIQTRTAIDSLRTKIRHDLTGAQFSPKEAREYEKFLPNVRDNAQIINAKLDALEKRYYADFGISLSEAGTAPKKVGKYTVRVK